LEAAALKFLIWSSRWARVGLLLLFGSLAAIAVHEAFIRSTQSLPLRFSFISGNLDEWTPYGGTWEVSKGAMQNASDERGAKLITGSPEWADYLLESDLQLSGSEGDAGLVVRVSDEEEGVDSYRGYYIGLSSQPYKLPQTDNLLIIGKADHAYKELVQASIPGGVIPFEWYHLKVLVRQCEIVASVSFPLKSGNTTTISTEDPNCIRAGKIGLRSYATGALWRDVAIRAGTQADLWAMLATKSSSSKGYAMASHGPETLRLPGFGAGGHLNSQQISNVKLGQEAQAENISSIADLRLTNEWNASPATVRGIVVATTPGLYIQDSNAGVRIVQKNNRLFNIGDEVQVTGFVHSNPERLVLSDATVNLLWAGAPVAPLSVTATQAAVGALNPTLVEVKGRLENKVHGPNDSSVLSVTEGQQSFLAIMTGKRASLLFDKLKVGSLLTLSGICVADPEYTKNQVPFALLLRSPGDVDVIAGPPWWSKGHVLLITLAVLIGLLVIQHVYSRVDRWRLRAVLQERERLAHEMHDTLAQSFAGIGFQLQAVRSELPSTDSRIRDHVELACHLVRQSHEEARRCIATLRPESLYQLGLLNALERCATRMVEGGSVLVHASGRGVPQVLPVLVSDTLFRIGQEAIANAVTHAYASSISITLVYRKNAVELSVEDDGRGFILDGSLPGFGLRGMRERARSVSANLQIRSDQVQGTVMVVTAPLPPQLGISTLPSYIWKYLREHYTHGTEPSLFDSRPDRR